MFVSSAKGSKFCCNRSTCPKNRYLQRDDSPLPSSSIDEIPKEQVSDKATQNSLTPKTSSDKNVSAKTPEKPSEADFDRNHQNIICCCNKFCPSNSSETSQKESDKCLLKLEISSPSSACTTIGTTSTRHKCNCKNLDTASSSSSNIPTTLLHFPRKLKRHSVEKQITNFPVKPERLQPNAPHTSYHEQFYSCSSDNSESDAELPCLYEPDKSVKNFVVLELLHEVINLINKDTPSREEVKKNLGGKMAITTQATGEKLKLKNKVSKSTSISQLSPVVWPQPSPPWPPCLCCNNRITSAPIPPYTLPFVQPYNLKFAAADGLEVLVPARFVYEKSGGIFKDCSSGKESEVAASKIPANLSCICPQHGAVNVVVGHQAGAAVQFNSDQPRAKGDIAKEKVAPFAYSNTLGNPEEDIDEELYPRYVDNIFVEPFGVYKPKPPYSLSKFDDEEPTYPDSLPNVVATEEVINLEDKTSDEKRDKEKLDNEPVALAAEIEAELEELSPSTSLMAALPLLDETLVMEEAIENNGLSAEQSSSHLIQGSSTNTTNVGIEKSAESTKHNTFKGSEEEIEFYCQQEEEHESSLVQKEYEFIREKRNKYTRNGRNDGEPNNDMVMDAIGRLSAEGSCAEMKYFIDSLIMDLRAMEYARRKTDFEKNVCKPKMAICARDSFPVTITEIKGLGANSLYVKWIIHDCSGIGGYEIYTDGYLTNRYYSSRHDAAVITHVDVTLPHKVALVAQPHAHDESIEMICNMTRENKNTTKSLLWNADGGKAQDPNLNFWTPSIFLYDPASYV